MADFLMPSLGADMAAGTLVAWRKQPGELVARGEIIAEVETDKGVIEIECFTSGVLTEQLVAPGSKVPVGTKLASIRDSDTDGASCSSEVVPPATAPSVAPQSLLAKAAPAAAPPWRGVQAPTAEALTESAQPASSELRATPSARRLMRERGLAPARPERVHAVITPRDLSTVPVPQPSAAGRSASQLGIPAAEVMRASPLARRVATELGISLPHLTAPGSGPSGYFTAADVRAHAQKLAPSATKPARPFDGARMRASIAQAMARSKREIPHFYLSHTVDLGDVLTWLQAENERRSMQERVLPGVLFVRAVALAISRVPELNAHYTAEGVQALAEVDVGMAVALRGGGLIAPAIMRADRLSLSELNRTIKDLIARARNGQLRSSEMAGASITVTSLGERGVESVLPVIIPPQVAMVGFGAVLERPLVVAGTVVARPSVTVTLAADHRVSDGHRGALFLSAIQTFLKEPPRDLSFSNSDRPLGESASSRAGQ